MKYQRDPHEFFRPGQVFSVKFSSEIQLKDFGYSNVDRGQLRLEPIDVLKTKYAWKKGAKERLEQIWALPLNYMVEYVEEDEHGRVICSLCHPKPPLPDSRALMRKEDWAVWHFRAMHWNLYQEMKNPSYQGSQKPTFSSERWITLKDINSDSEMPPDWRVESAKDKSSFGFDLYGPFLLRRFVVVREGIKSCLCLGIHT